MTEQPKWKRPSHDSRPLANHEKSKRQSYCSVCSQRPNYFHRGFFPLLYKQVFACADLLSNPLICRIRFFFGACYQSHKLQDQKKYILFEAPQMLQLKKTAVVFKVPRVFLSEFNVFLIDHFPHTHTSYGTKNLSVNKWLTVYYKIGRLLPKSLEDHTFL